ncbi:MAG TPA: hypothetical protein VMZ26_17050 [Pyrinomonadaceae bacterium]|nr:hypothetical protein [Pyrinomonadaceae bacterium]
MFDEIQPGSCWREDAKAYEFEETRPDVAAKKMASLLHDAWSLLN